MKRKCTSRRFCDMASDYSVLHYVNMINLPFSFLIIFPMCLNNSPFMFLRLIHSGAKYFFSKDHFWPRNTFIRKAVKFKYTPSEFLHRMI